MCYAFMILSSAPLARNCLAVALSASPAPIPLLLLLNNSLIHLHDLWALKLIVLSIRSSQHQQAETGDDASKTYSTQWLNPSPQPPNPQHTADDVNPALHIITEYIINSRAKIVLLLEESKVHLLQRGVSENMGGGVPLFWCPYNKDPTT